jgi:hypothetical protein
MFVEEKYLLFIFQNTPLQQGTIKKNTPQLTP